MSKRPKSGGKKKKEEDSVEELEKLKRIQNAKDIKFKYVFACARYVTEPISTIIKKLDDSINSGKEFNQIIINHPKLFANDIVAMDIGFRLTELKMIRIWKCQLLFQTLDLLVEMIINRPTIKGIDLIGCSFAKSNEISLFTLASKMKNITILVLDYTILGDHASHIFHGLISNSNCCLITLSMRYCHINSKVSLDYIGKFLTACQTITYLDLGGNLIKDEGLKEITKSIETIKSLKSLNLSFNEIEVIGPSAFTQLCYAIGSNHTLTHVNLTGNFFNEMAFQTILQALELRKGLVLSKLAPPLELLVSERVNNVLYEKIHNLNIFLASKATTGKKKK
ncbi:hypothetical protein BC833DRAFT_594899 [Globomyces pollinis-pini]|nr:hypothetical protein BC833DRAFT_594899 [Globomyces pollinis-pini]